MLVGEFADELFITVTVRAAELVVKVSKDWPRALFKKVV